MQVVYVAFFVEIDDPEKAVDIVGDYLLEQPTDNGYEPYPIVKQLVSNVPLTIEDVENHTPFFNEF